MAVEHYNGLYFDRLSSDSAYTYRTHFEIYGASTEIVAAVTDGEWMSYLRSQ